MEISEKLYSAVAVALAYIYKIDMGELNDEPQIDIPEDLRFNENGKVIKIRIRMPRRYHKSYGD